MGSEDGQVYFWEVNRQGQHYFQEAKPKGYEAFNPFMIQKFDQNTNTGAAKLSKKNVESS